MYTLSTGHSFFPSYLTSLCCSRVLYLKEKKNTGWVCQIFSFALLDQCPHSPCPRSSDDFAHLVLGNYLFIFWERVQAGKGQRERGTEDLKRVLCWQQQTRCGTQEPWDHDLSQSWTLNGLSHPGPQYEAVIFLSCYSSSNVYFKFGFFKVQFVCIEFFFVEMRNNPFF